MPIGPFGEIIGTTGTLEGLSEAVTQGYKSKVVAPRNPKVVKGAQAEFKIKPSQFMFQMGLDTEKKLANQHTMKIPVKTELLDMSETSHQKESKVSIDEPMFQPFPSEIFFQNYEPFETYEVPLVLRNNDKVPRLVKVTQADSPYFKVISPHNVGHKVGPGLPTTFRVQFTPEEKKDYNHTLVCITEREKFVVPVRCIGARAILDFPDEVNFPVGPVKYSSTKTLLVRNIGNREAKFHLQTNKPYHVTPQNGTLPVNESIQITVEYKPTTTGDHKGELVLHYDTGENVYISLYGAAQDANVRLDKNSIRVENTFISMANQRTVTITNRSDVICHFRWTQFATQEEEDMQKMSFYGTLDQEERTERDRFMEECLSDPSLRDKFSILSRSFQNKKKVVEDDRLLFADDVIKIEPVDGDIWPNSSREIEVIFKPSEARTYQRTAFCDITGRESRLPLRIRGDGAGPKVQFSFDELDMGNIFVNSTHHYEVVLANKGDIDAIFNLIPSSTKFGPLFTFNPSEGIVMPDGHQAIHVTFSSPTLGDFDEDFYFQVDGSPEKLKLKFKGAVIGPTFHFDVPRLRFGTVSYGFTSSQTCTLANTALVPMTFTLRVPGDGVAETISCTSDYDSTVSEASSVAPPKEFEIVPSSGKLEPSSEQEIRVDICSNSLKKYDLSLVVDVEGVGDEILSLPITAKCTVPAITVITPLLDYGRCFLRYPYQCHVKLQNDTDLPAKYELLSQQIDEMTPICYSSPKPKGIVDPHSVHEVPLVITAQALEEQEAVAFFSIFGSSEPPIPVHLSCVGEGPVVHVTPMALDWGPTSVLVDTPKILHLSNESLVPAKFTAVMTDNQDSKMRPNSVWRVEPNSGEIPPEGQLDLIITATLDDCVRFQDKLQVNFLESQVRTVPVNAYGHGTTIVADPPMSPTLNLGPHFSRRPCRRMFTLTNRGRRHQSLVWSTEGFSLVKPKKTGLMPINPKDMKYRDMPAQPAPPRPVFSLTPARMELNPGESREILLEGQVDDPRIVKERMLCHAIIGRAGGKELIMKVAVSSEFITPLLEFSADDVSFRVDKPPSAAPEEALTLQTKELTMTNVSSLPLTTQLTLNHPFNILIEDKPINDMELNLGIGQSQTLKIQFDPAYKEDYHIRTIEETLTVAYKEHPHVDNISLRGEVYFPNLAFEKEEINFGCILNDTEVTRYVNITNNSPMEVNYKWSFLIDGKPVTVFHKRAPSVEPIEDELEECQLEGQGQEEGDLGDKVEVEFDIEGAENSAEETEQVIDIEQKDGDAEKDNMAATESDGEEKKDEEKPVEDDAQQVEPPVIVEDGKDAEGEELEDQQEVDGQTSPAQDQDIQQTDRTSLASRASQRPSSRVSTARTVPAINPVLAQLLEQQRAPTPMGVEEIFDILPLYGSLKPGETEQVTLTFFGHADMGSLARAVCEVEGGPTYELKLTGEASLVEYHFDCLDIDYGKQMYDQVAVAELVLYNTGRVGFEYFALGMDPAMASKPKPGIPVMIPHAGYIEPFGKQTLTIKYLPGVPEKFHKNFQIQVAHFEPDTINLYGEGVFPRISLDLPRHSDEGGMYMSLLKEAKETLSTETKKSQCERPSSAVSATHRDTSREDEIVHHENCPSELEIQMEVERLMVKEFAQNLQEITNRPDVLEVHTAPTDMTRESTRDSKKQRRRQKPKARLPDYILDFGHVILGTVRTHVVRATNTGWYPVSFSVDREGLYQQGFNVELDRVRQLPGAPDHETVDFVVSFDPRGANLGLGQVEAMVLINIINGPLVSVLLRANVTMPDMQISTDVVNFGDVRCGECMVVTVQLHNHKHVRCEWNSAPTDKDKRMVDKHVPMHLRRKLRQERAKPRTFEMMPPTGTLEPNQRLNVQVKFMPTEERFYEQRIPIRLAQSSQRIMLLCRGQGQEPCIEFEPTLVEFGPILPHSSGDEKEIIIRNPCGFPIELYNLEFDKQYLEEEKILRLMKGYDEYNTILLPPRQTGDKLPQELLDYYDEQMKKLEEAEKARREAEEAAEAARRELEEREAAEKAEAGDEEGRKSAADEDKDVPMVTTTAPSHASQDIDPLKTDRSSDTKDYKRDDDEDKLRDGASSIGVGELEITPVSAAIARHLGIDLSAEGKAARNRRGIAIIVHGAPMSGKSSTAVHLAKRYEAALLTVDKIVQEAISSGNTPAGLRARELCSEAARKRAEELRALEGEGEPDKKAAGGLSVEALTAHTQGTGAVSNAMAAQSVAQSITSNKKASSVSDQKSKGDKHHSSTTGKTAVGNMTSSGEGGSQVPSSPPPLSAPIARRLSVSASVAGEEGLMSCVLPEDLLVEILAERLMLSDCHRGVVFDSLDTVFSQNMFTTAHAILKAFNNRKYLFFVTLKLDYNVMKEQEKKAQEEQERLAKEHQEEERLRLEEMSEDEYDALTEEEKAEVDRKRLDIKKERIRREMEERQERERREQEAREAEMKRQEEEKLAKKKRKQQEGKDGKKGPAAGKATEAKSTERVAKSQGGPKPHGESEHSGVGKAMSTTERPESHLTEKSDKEEPETKKKEKKGKDGKRPVSQEQKEQEEQVRDPVKEAELLLLQKFRTFEHTMKDIECLVDHWDRSTGTVRPATPLEGMGEDADGSHPQHPPSGKKGKKAKEAEKKAAEKAKEAAAAKDSAKDGNTSELGFARSSKHYRVGEGGEMPEDEESAELRAQQEEERRQRRLEEGIGLPNVILDGANRSQEPGLRVVETGKLPTPEEVLDGLGLGENGPPIPPAASFGVVPYPVKRHAPPGAEGGHYIFVASSPDDPNISTDEKPSEAELDEEKSVTPDGRKGDHETPTKDRKKRELRAGADSQKDKRKASAKARSGRRSSAHTTSPPPGVTTPASETEGSTSGDAALSEPKNPKLGHFRWIIPENGEVKLRLRFQSEDLGQFDQTLNFEIMGTRRRYQLYCRGICAFPTISREPRIVFPHRKKNKKQDEIVQKKYVLTSETFEFGPLLVGKSRERYKEGRYPENMEIMTIQNTSPLDAEISFCFLNDSKGETYLLDPPNMSLKPGESQELKVWAYPKVPGSYEDSLVCCVRENPEPIIFKLVCHGVRPELELDKKQLHFDKVLLHRKDTKTLYLRNSTLLPVAWRLNGLENLGDDFSVSQEAGIIEPKSEYALNAYFRAMKQVNVSKKFIRLEVMDVDNIMGVVQTENIQVHAEAYDVALDMSFPKGADGGIDFDIIRVDEEQKQTCSLKNKGRYDIDYMFIFDSSEGCPKEVCDMFTVAPARGRLSSNDRPTQVQITFHSEKEVTVKDQPILRCQVIEPNISEGGETIASIPIKISVKSVFSKYNIYPVSDINFGPMMLNSRKPKTFVIENKGERYDFKYTITKAIKETAIQQASRARPPVKSDKRSKSRDGSSSGRSATKAKRAESLSSVTSHNQIQTPSVIAKGETKKRTARQEATGAGNQRLVLGMFTIYPAYGFINAGNQQVITVDCLAETPGRCEEEISIDITGREPIGVNPETNEKKTKPIPYRLIAEACVPSINVSDIASIFEEHRICKNLNIWQDTHQLDGGGVFGEDENRFVFNNVLVGMKARARYKIVNSNKVPCDVMFTVKPIVTRQTSRHQDVFEVEPPRAQIPAHSHVFATVSFTPPSMQYFSAVFEAAIEGIPQNQAKGRNLTFEVAGEGNLPRVGIVKPTIRNKKGQPLLLYQRNLIGRAQTLPMVITNDGTLPSKVDIDLMDPDSVFSVRPSGDTKAITTDSLSAREGKKLPHTASVILGVKDTATFDIIFKPTTVQRSQGQIRLTVINNQYEDSVIQLVGEGYEDEITLDNIHSILQPVDPEQEEGNMAEDDVQAAKSNHIKFGDCYINEPRTLTFSMTNHSKTDTVRFQWPEHPQLKFSPMLGHLHPKSTKDMSVTFRSEVAKSLQEHEVPCKVTKITFEKPANEVADWDDRLRTVKWVDLVPTPAPAPSVDGNSSSNGAPRTPVPPTPGRTMKRKVVETEPEPTYTEVAESSRTVDLLVSVTADHCKYKCKTDAIHFKDTLMFQTRIFEFVMSNKGSINMDYNWRVLLEEMPSGPRSVTFAEGEPSRPATASALAVRPGSAARPGSGASSIISDSLYMPFSIEPQRGAILPGKKTTFRVKFSPLDVQDYEARLLCSIPNLEEGQQGPVVGVRARSLMPYCHFELEDSDYIRSARRNPEMRGPGGAPAGTTLDPNTRVIEYKSVGIGVKLVRRFFIVNPTNQEYSFMWVNEDDQDPKRIPDFHCLTPRGHVKCGKKTEISFEFTSSQLDVVESFWRFVIPEHNISVPFLMVGNTNDPNVSLDRSHLNFKALLIGHEAVETVMIINKEDVPFHFSFVESSLHSSGYKSHIMIEPMSGTLPPQGRMPINIFFTPTSEKEVNFNVVCNIKKKTHPLTLNVKAEGYSMNCLVLCEDSAGNKVELSPTGTNEINFGDVEVFEKSMRNVFIVNSGKFNFDYTWEVNERTTRKEPSVAVKPREGAVPFGDRKSCELTFCPLGKTTLRGCELILKISNGPTFYINVTGNGIPPGLHFSFPSHNFGPCFIHRAGMPTHSTTLMLTNRDSKEISVECLYSNTSHLHHDFKAKVISPGQTENVTFTFYPREVIKYHEVVTFEINGLSKQSVEFFGQGTEMKIEVADPKQKIVKLGALRVGQVVKKQIPIVNNSPAPITFVLAITPSNSQLQDSSVLKISPTSEITLAPKGGTAKVEVVFSPKSRVPQFTEEVLLECAGLYQPLFVVNGSCLGIDIHLDTDHIPFGQVIQRSSSTRKLVMTNAGDIGARFQWDAKRFLPDFSISPVDGYISPGMEVQFEVTFHPQDVNQDIRYDDKVPHQDAFIRYKNLRCMIEGSKPLKFTLTGMCVTVPPVKEVVHFSTHVRQKEMRQLNISNRTNMLWKLRPVIEGEFFSGPETFVVEPQQSKSYELTYKPLVMTQENKKHTGTVFFPVPDGSGMMFNVAGTADPPKPTGKIQRDIPCKTSYCELLTVSNWLKKPQRFKVKFDLMKPDRLDSGTTVNGLEYIDVPGNSKRDYKVTFYAHREGQSQFKVIFSNEQTWEYQYYEVTFRATRPGTIAEIELATPVRKSVQHTISLENPLSNQMNFTATCNNPEIMMPGQLHVPPESTGAFNLEYLPLKVGTSEGRIELVCNDLGLYTYDLKLKATPAGPERALHFRTCLGTTQMQTARFLNFAKQKTDYSCKVDNGDFHVDKTVAAAPGSPAGTEVMIEVTYEPSRIGESRGTLVVSSQVGGDYTFPLFGTCVAPKPQGPYIIKAGSTSSITFRNVFPHPTPFTFQVDNPLFHVTKPGDNIRAHKDHRVVVGFDGNDSGSKAAVMGKLIVTCAKSAGGASNVQWVYYLKGVTP